MNIKSDSLNSNNLRENKFSSSSVFWISLSFIIKGILFLLLINELGVISFSKFAGIIGGDTSSYLEPIESLISKGVYEPDFRMPGYGWIYYLLRLLFDQTASENLLIFCQFVLSSISVYYLALSAKILFKSKRIFYLVFFSYLISTYTAIFDIILLTESFTVSATIFGIYFLAIGFRDKNNKYFFISGLFFTWITFLRPVYFIYFLICLLFIMAFRKRNNYSVKKTLTAYLLFLLSFLIIDSIWVIHNSKQTGKILPLTKSFQYTGTEESYYSDMMRFLQSWGGSFVFWDPTSEIRWFGLYGEKYGDRPWMTELHGEIPDYIYTNSFNRDSLFLVKGLIARYTSTDITEQYRDSINSLLKKKLSIYTKSIKTEHPFLYYIKAPMILFKKQLIHSGTYNLMKEPWEKLNTIKRSIKLFYAAQYLFILFAGFIGIFYVFIRKRKIEFLIFPVMTLYGVIIFPIILRFSEMRYFVPTFPLMLVCAMYALDKIIDVYKKNKLPVKN